MGTEKPKMTKAQLTAAIQNEQDPTKKADLEKRLRENDYTDARRRRRHGVVLPHHRPS
jgi:hypothetical protein